MAAKRKPGLVCTFYSYKGGVGRSMALANVAVLLSRLGQKVLVIDWDLEAPGLEQYFGPQYRSMRRSTPGLLDLIDSYRSGQPTAWDECLLKATIPQGEAVDIIHAGRDDEKYSDRLRSIDWDRLFEMGFGRALEDTRNELKQIYDYIFIDSRTGITDIGGICSILLPDYLVSLFTTTEQSVLGVKDTMTRARAAQRDLPLDRQRLIIIPIAARDESTTEYKRAAEWRRRFAQELSGFYDDWIPKDETPESVLDYLKIPYVAYWSFGEQLPVLSEDASNPKNLAYSYALIARLIHSRLDWSEVREGRETTELQSQRAAEVQTRLAEAAKARTEALTQQQAEANKILEERRAALIKRFDYLVEETRARRRNSLLGIVACAAVTLISFVVAGYVMLTRADSAATLELYNKLGFGSMFLGVTSFTIAVIPLFYFRQSQRAVEALRREFAAYTIAHGIYAELGTEASLRLFGDRIERIAEGESSASESNTSSPSAASAPTPGTMSAPTPLPRPPAYPVSIGPTPSSSLPPLPVAIDEMSSIDVLLTYSSEGIARDWAFEFIPLFSRWLSETLGRNATVVDGSLLLVPGLPYTAFDRAAVVARTAVMILRGRTREIESSRELSILLEHISPERLFAVRLGPMRRGGKDNPLARLKAADFSDLAYVGEGFAKSERYIDFQDRVRALAQEVADAIEQDEMRTLSPKLP